MQRALPESDVVVHVEPSEDEPALRERAHAAALGVPRVREMHNLTVLDVGRTASRCRCTSSCRATCPLDEAHGVAEAGRARDPRRACRRSPTCRPTSSRWPRTASGEEVEADAGRRSSAIVREATGVARRALRFLHTDDGLVVRS